MSISQNTKKLNPVVLLCCSILVFLSYYLLLLPSLFISPIVTRGEGREAQVVQAMERTQELILPLRNGTTVPSKPPLFHWISYYTGKICNSFDPGIIRHPSLLCASLLLAVFFYYTAQQLGSYVAFLSSGILLSSTEFLRYSTQARVDMVFACFFCFAILCLHTLQYKKNIFRICVCIACIGLATLAKGPFGFILSIGTICIYQIVTRSFFYRSNLVIVGIISLLSLLLAASWYGLAYNARGEAFLETQLLKENFARVVKSDTVELGHEKPIYYTLIYFLQVSLPWTIFIPRIINSIRSPQYAEYVKKHSYILLHVVVTCIFFIAITGSVSKRSVYFLPALPSIAILFATGLEYSARLQLPSLIKGWEHICMFAIKAFSGFLVITICVAFLGIYFAPNLFNKLAISYSIFSYIQPYTSLPVVCIGLILSVVSIFVIKQYFTARFDYFIRCFSIFVFLVFLSVQYIIAPIFLNKISPEKFIQEVRNIIGDTQLYQIEDEFYAPVFYLISNAPMISVNEIKKKNVQYALIGQKDLDENRELLPPHHIIIQSQEKLANKKDTLLLVSFSND